MWNLFDTLFQYAHENRVGEYLQTAEYRRTVYDREAGWEAFRSVLTKEQEKQLEEVLCQQGNADRLEEEAIFLAGVTIGLDLGRL